MPAALAALLAALALGLPAFAAPPAGPAGPAGPAAHAGPAARAARAARAAHAGHPAPATAATLPPPTRAQLAEVAAATARYRDIRTATREGWKRFGGDESLMGEHWHHPQGPDYVGADALDFRRPSNLMYTDIGGRKVLTGVAFNVRLRDDEPLPQGFAGSADRWHVHDMLGAIAAATAERPVLRWLANWWLDANYRNRGDDRGRLAMVHAWVTLPNPDGVFADVNRTIPYLKLGLPAAHADGATLAAARGLDLATPAGCKAAIDGRLWIAAVPARLSRSLHVRCAAAAAGVRVHLTSPAAQLNRAAAAAWSDFDAQWTRVLTPGQRARIAAIGEHGDHPADNGEHQGH